MANQADYWIENGKGYARTVELASAMVSAKPRTLREWLEQGCPGKPGRYCPSEIVEWARDHKWAVRRDDDDPEVEPSAGPSPALERLRDEKAKIARLDRLERERQLVKTDDLRETLLAVAGLLRGAGEQLRRQFGNEALAILNEALDEAERKVEGLDGGGD